MHMRERTLYLLEFPKVLSRLAKYAVSEAGCEACTGVRPAETLESVQYQSNWLRQGRIWMAATAFPLASFPNLQAVLRFLEAPSAVLELDALWALRQTLTQAKAAITMLVGGKPDDAQKCQWPLLRERAAAFSLPSQCIAALARCLSDDGFLRDEASPELLLARGEIRRLHQMCTRKVKEFIKNHNLEQYLQDDYMTLSSDRYVLPLKANFKGRMQGIIHDYSQTGETCYFEPLFLVEVNNRLQELRREEREAELKVLRFLTQTAREEQAGITGAYALLIDLDVLQAVCALATCYGGEQVVFDTDRPMHLHDARHALLALQHVENVDNPKPVPVDIVLNPTQRGLIISGGNAGGKTVSLKTLGLTALLGMCGLPVPVGRGASLPFWRNIHVFIGDEQSIEDHVSTFTAQIRQLARIWDSLDEHTLVILDEFGAGTDPAQGAALAQAVVDGILDRGAYVVAATHFPALKAYALSRENVRAASVLFDPDSRKPLFRLAYEQVGASQALIVAKEHGLPESVLRRAEQYLLLDGQDTSALLERLNTLAVDRERELAALAADKEKLREKRLRMEERFIKERENLFTAIQADAQAVLREWKASRISHKQALKELSRVRKGIAACGNTESADEAAISAAHKLDIASLPVGTVVRYLPWGKEGSVVGVDFRLGRVRLDISGITLWTEITDLAPARASASTVPQLPAFAAASVSPSPGLRLDLRGMRADVAITELERFLDSALLRGLMEIDVVNGRGTGVLRREVHTFLKRFSAVRSFALASEEQGGDGMTHVLLK